ncbi:MAG: hypothetical protein JSW28_06470, partial [Thermoplasmata archaeon]
MKKRIVLITALIFTSMLVITAGPASAEPEYDQTKYDPLKDVMRVRTGGDFKFEDHDDVEITKMTSAYEGGLLPTITMTMMVEGTIQDGDAYKYAFVIQADGETYIFGYSEGAAIGFKLGSEETLAATATKSGGTLEITFRENAIGSPSSFDFTAGAIYSKGDYERYVDLAPDKLILITEPSDGSTVDGSLTIKGWIRDSVDSQPGNTISLSVDGNALDVTGTKPWSATLETTTLSEGDHTLYVEVDGTEYNDQITIKVDQDTANYASFDLEPEVHIGDWYHYELLDEAAISGIDLSLSNEMDSKVLGLETLDGTEVFKIWSHTYGEQHIGPGISYSNTIDRTSWKEKDGFGSFKDYTVALTDVTGRDETKTETTTTYSKPLETHNNFQVTVGYSDNTWVLTTRASSTSQTTVAGGDPQQNPSYNDDLSIHGECLYYLSSVNIHGNSFTDIYLIKTQYENPGVSIVEYYSPELGVPVRIDTFDPSRNLLFSLGLESWEQVPFSIEILGEVSFDPAEPKADSKNKITVQIKNVGDEPASNIEITVKDGAREVGDETIASLSAGETKDVTVDWTPNSEGNHTIIIEASTDSIDLAQKTVYVDVKPGGGGNGGTDMSMFLLIIGVIAVVAVVLVVVLISRKKKPAEGEIPPASESGEGAPAAAEGAGAVVVATQEIAAEPAQADAAAQTRPAATEETAAQEFMESIKCPSCQN